MFLPFYNGVLIVMPLSVARIYYPVKTLGPGRRVGIWTAGCSHNCRGCISPELQSADAGQRMATSEIIALVNRVGCTPEGFTISGGEPFLQVEALCGLVEALALISDDILIYTGFLLDELIATVYKGNIIKNLIMDCQSYTKYRPNETTGGIFVSWRRKEELPTGA